MGVNLVQADLSESDLIMAQFSLAKLSRANFFRSNLIGSDFWAANLKGANFTGADIRGTNLELANFDEVNLINVYEADPERIKTACYWQKAKMSDMLRVQIQQAPEASRTPREIDTFKGACAEVARRPD